jgi:hypothetical protein
MNICSIDNRNLNCKGTGLLPPYVKHGEHQVKCPTHSPRIQSWPRFTKDSGIEFINLKTGKVLKNNFEEV